MQLPATKNPPPLPGDQEILQASVQALLDSLWQNYRTETGLDLGGILFQAQHGETQLFCKTNLPSDVTHNSFFRAASVTKTFTASAIMLLNQRNKLNIDDLITGQIPGRDIPYLPDNDNYDIPFKDQITIRSLLEHRAGVFDPTNYDIPDSVAAEYAGMNWVSYIQDIDEDHYFTIDEVIAVIAKHHLYQNEPDVQFSYSNTGYMLLGKIVERVSGKSLEEFFIDELCNPNGLFGTSFPLNTQHLLPQPKIDGWIYLGDESFIAEPCNMSFEKAQGNLVTTSNDLLSWLLKWQKGQAGLNLDTVLAMRQSSEPGHFYGLGTYYIDGLGYGHDGALAGYLTLMFYDPSCDYGFVILCNVWSYRSEEQFFSQMRAVYDIAKRIKALIVKGDGSAKPLRGNLPLFQERSAVMKHRN